MVESSRSNSENVDNFDENSDIEILYEGEEADGFDVTNGNEWIYPTNYPIRAYQKNIVSNALFKNTLVCLPTGLGKTFIAAVVMYNYHRWYPKHIVVFMAHSKPLVTQQVNACCNIMGISPSVIAELNGNMQHANRKKQWESKKIFFLTPQVFNNDLARGNVKAESIRCIVIDEAHKALGNQAYCQVIRSIKPFNSKFRVLALSATPGDDMNMVREVIKNLMISHLELRNEEDPDIKPYLHEKKVETVIVKLDQQILEIKEMFLRAVDKYIKPLVRHKLLPQSFSSINPFSLVLKQRQFVQNPSVGPELRGIMLSNFSVAISLFHALEELIIHGMKSFVTKLKNLQTGEGSTNKAHHRIANDDDIKLLIDHVTNILAPNHDISLDANNSITRIFDEIDGIETSSEIVYSHPKFIALEKIIREHFSEHKDSTKVIVFCKSRQCTGEICVFLARFKPLVKPMIFIGQSQSTGGIVAKGFNQSAQLTVMKRFREGYYNTLIATCVAEEGLDIGEVDLIINFDSGKNSNTQVQRSGRTGRKRDGRVVNLVTEGKEHQNYNISISKGKKMSKKLVSDSTNLPFYLGSSRLLPKGFKPICQEMYFPTNKVIEEEPKVERRRSKGTKKKLEDAEEVQARKRMKESTTSECNVWTVIADDKEKISEKVDDQRNGGINEKEMEFICGEQFSNDVEIIDSDNEPNMILYNDDVEECTDDDWESEEIGEEERNLVNEFLKENNTMLKPKNNFREFFDLKQLSKYWKLLGKKNIDIISKLRTVQNNSLQKDGEKSSTSESLVTKTCSNESGQKLTLKEENNSVVKEKPKTAEVDVLFDIDPDEFFNPFEDFLPAAKSEMVSSTPMRTNKENLIPPTKNASLIDSNIQQWDDSDFFNVKENLSTKKEKTVSNVDQSELKEKKNDCSLMSITQALDFVNKSGPSKSIIQSVEKENNNARRTPSSPILFFSQRQTSRSKFVPNSPVLTQFSSGKRTTRKCLNFHDESYKSPMSKEIPKFQDADASDLFAETEIALQNNLQELEKNMNYIEKNSKVERKTKESPISRPTTYSWSSEDTEEYDVGKVNLEENCKLAALLESVDKSGINNGLLEKSDGVLKITNENINRNVSNFSNRKEQGNEDIGLSRLDFSSFMKSDTTEKKPPFMESTPIRSNPKMAIVRPMGFENTPISNKMAVDNRKSESKKVAAKQEPSFTCNFSLFGDDDFGEECFDVEKSNKEIEEKKKSEACTNKIIQEDEEASNDSDIFINKNLKQNAKPNPPLSPEYGDLEIMKNKFEDCELSEEEIEAIKAVEIYEKNAGKALKNFDSDDSDDFFVPARKETKLDRTKNDSVEMTKIKPSKKKKNKNVEKSSAAKFIEREADISYDGKISSDEENVSGLDDYDSSFVDEEEVLTQAQGVDMTAKYLQSMKNSRRVGPGTFKIPKSRIQEQMNVFSQVGSEGESEYENDSFCVAEEESYVETNEISELELAELILEDKKKRKRGKDRSIASVKKKKKFRRVCRIESDSSDDDVVEIVAEPKKAIATPQESTSKIEDFEELFNTPFPAEISTDSLNTGNANATDRIVVFIASRQIATSPEITTCLRAKWNVNVHVRSAPEADYIISWRVGINRIPLSDFVNGSANSKNSLKEMVQKLTSYFQEPVIIVEDDKNKGLPLTVGCHKYMWAKHSSRTLIKIIQNNVKVLFSRNKNDTARIVVNLCNEERRKGNYINLTGDLHPEIEKRMKFYSSLPGVNVANAVRIAGKFYSMSSFVKSCDSLSNIMRELGLKKDAATSVYQLMFTTPP